MSSLDRRSAGRRRAWGRGPVILKFEPLEKREVLSVGGASLPDLVASSFVSPRTADWNDTLQVSGKITNQGRAAATAPFRVDIYASHGPSVGPYAVKVGEVSIPAQIGPGQSVPFSTTVKLPASPVPGVDANGSLYLDLKVDPTSAVTESNRRNNWGIGVGRDEALVKMTAQAPAKIQSTALGVYPTTAEWGGIMSVTAQIKNNSQTNAPATRAAVVLTPWGINPGSSSDVTIGDIPIPAIPAWQTVNVEQHINLPVTPPNLLTNYSQFTLSVLPDANYQINPVYPHYATQGLGSDMTQVTINVPAGTTPPSLGSLPDLAANAVNVSSSDLNWGQAFQVQTTVQNLGISDPGPFRVRFVLVGMAGDASHGIFLGDTLVPGLPAGASQSVSQQLTLPTRLPAGVNLSSIGYAKIAVFLDPENTINETFRNNNTSTSGPITLRVLGTDGTSTVPTFPAPGLLPAANKTTPGVKAKKTAAQKAAANKKLYHKVPPANNSLAHKLSVFPKQVNDLIKKWI